MKKFFSLFAKYILPILPFVLVFIAALYTPKDPDLGWHLKYGEYFFKHGQILRDNIFSTEMTDFKWANTSWLTDLISYSLFNNLGFLGLTLGGAAVITLTFYIYSKLGKLTLWDQTLLFPILLYFEQPLNWASFKGQLLSILLLGIMFYLISLYEESEQSSSSKKSKKIFLIIPLFLLWINLHGQSVLGLGLFLAWIGLYLLINFISGVRDKLKIREAFKKILPDFKTLSFVFILSFLATLINPFGINLYRDAVVHFSSPDLKFIAEYLPFEDLSVPWWNQIIIGIMIMFGFIFMLFGGGNNLKENSTQRKLPLLGIISLLYGLSFLIRRYAWSLYYLTLPILKPLAQFFKPDLKRNEQFVSFIILSFSIAFIIYLRLPLTQFTQFSWEKFCDIQVTCSKGVAEHLLKNTYSGKMLTFYDYGGWLIWNYPEIKPSIDGRMHLWRDEKGRSAFNEYYPYEQNMSDIDSSKYDTVFMAKRKPMYQRLVQLVQEKRWKIVYQDNYAGIFVRNNKR